MNNMVQGSQDNNTIVRRAWNSLTFPSTKIKDAGDQRSARLAASFLFAITMLNLVGGIARVPRLGFSGAFSGELGATILISFIAYGLSRTQWYQFAIFIFAVSFSSTAYTTIIDQGNAGNFSSLVLIYVPISLIVASSFLSSWWVFLLTGLNIGAMMATQWLGIAPPANFGAVAGIVTTIGVILIILSNFRDAVEKARLDEVRTINRELEDLTSNLEKRVMDRTDELDKTAQLYSKRAYQLQSITELSESISQFQNLNELFPAVSQLISERFGFYHIGIFLLDQDNAYAVLQASNSEGGKRLLERGHRLAIGTGVVGFSALSGQPRIALDVGDDAVFFDNPDLPNTRSEAAVPLKARSRTIGILDVQSTEPNAFSPDDLQVLTALANQVAISMENLRLLTETRAALAQVQQVYDEFTRAEWSKTITNMGQPGFRYNDGRIEIVDDRLDGPEVASVVETGQVIKTQTESNEEKRSLVVVPVKFRGEVIGILQLEANETSREYLDDEVSLVEAIAERAAFAMENARLFQDARRRAAKEQLISQATSKISSALDIENILLATAEELENVLGGSEVLIRFQGKETE